MITVEVRNMDRVKAALAALPPNLRSKAIGPALNRTAQKARAELARAIPEEYAVKAAEVRSAVVLRRASTGKPEARIDIFGSKNRRGRSLNLIHFLAAYQAAGKAYKVRGGKGNQRELKALAGQLGFMIKKSGGLKRIAGAFVGNNGRTVFRRSGKARLPIEPLQVIGFSQMFNSRRINARIMSKIADDLLVETNRSIAKILGQQT